MKKINCNNCETENSSSNKYCTRCGYELPVIEIVEEIVPKKQKETKFQKKKILTSVVTVITFFISYYAVQQIFFTPPSYDKMMMEVASELNKTCPMMIDSETRLDNAISIPENVFQYNYTLINMDKESVDVNEMKKYLEPTIINNVKTNPQMKIQRDNKTTINYYYKDKNGQHLLTISVTPDKYF